MLSWKLDDETHGLDARQKQHEAVPRRRAEAKASEPEADLDPVDSVSDRFVAAR